LSYPGKPINVANARVSKRADIRPMIVRCVREHAYVTVRQPNGCLALRIPGSGMAR